MTHNTDTFVLQVITMRERMACLKTAAMGHARRDVLISQINRIDQEMAELEMAARQSVHQSNGDHRNGHPACGHHGKPDHEFDGAIIDVAKDNRSIAQE